MEDTEPSSELRPQQPSPVAADTADLSSQQPWKYDIATEHASLTTTGGRIWDAARRLASYLEAMSGPLGLQRPGLRVLELGAGLGWLGMTLARNIRVDPRQGGMVVLTEQEAGGGLDWLRHNLRLNAAALGLQGEGLQDGGLQQGGRQAAASVGQQVGQGGEGQGEEGQQQQPAVRAEACDWFLYCNPDLVTARAGAGAGDRGDQGSQGGGGGGGATGAAAGSATGQATTSADAGTAAASRRYAEPLAPGASLAAAGLAAAAATTAAVAATTTAAVAATAATAVATAAAAGAAGAAGGTGADGCSGSGGSGPGADTGGAGDGAVTGGGGGGEWLSGVAWDLIIGSDLVYNEVGAVYLPRVLRALSRPGHTRVLYAHTKHRFDTWDMRFYEELAAQGLSLAEVHEPGVPSPPPSPPPLTELFPDMRVAVFQIGLQQPPK